MESILQHLHIDLQTAQRKMLDESWKTENFRKEFRIVPWCRFYLPLKGEAYYSFNNRRYTLRPGSILLIPPFFITQAQCDTTCDLCWVNFNTFIRNCKVDFFSLYHPPWELPVENFDFSKTLFLRLLEVIRQLESSQNPHLRAAARFEAESIFRILILPFLRAAEPCEEDGGDMHSFFHLLNYIEEHLGENLTLHHLAEQCGMNPTYLTNLFSKRIGLSLMRYCTIRKVVSARNLLDNSNMNISEIAYSLGYADPNNFARIFKKIYGRSPLKVRKCPASPDPSPE